MIEDQKLFGNYFDDIHITTTRLFNFGSDALNSLIKANNGGDLTNLISLLTGALNTLKVELASVDTSFTLQKGATITNDQVLLDFQTVMSKEEPFIARAVGGKNSAVYQQFYPKGIKEYSNASKTMMSTLTTRINVAATTNATQLGTALTSTLQAFETDWKNSRDTQVQQRSNVGEKRAGQTDARTAVELALIIVIGSVIAKFPGNVDQCRSFFNFNTLFPQTKSKNQVFSRPLAVNETATVLNHTFTDAKKITIRNTNENASLAVWLSPNEKDQSPANAREIKPGKTIRVKPSDLGDLKNTFLLIKNMSGVNDGAYEVVAKLGSR